MHFKDRSGKSIQYKDVNNTMQDVLHYMSYKNNSFFLRNQIFYLKKIVHIYKICLKLQHPEQQL